jgi:hypothetical protein
MKSLSLILFLSLSGLLLSQKNYITLSSKEMIERRNADKANNGIHPNAREISKDSLSKLKAVLIIGGGFEGASNNFIYDSIEKKLNQSGIKLTKVYPNIPLDSIYKKTKGANILIYVGHGMEKGCLSMSNNHILQSDFKKLGLSKNHIVVLQHACYSAGSSENDSEPIGIDVAKKRVYNYSKGFIDNGALLYFATGSSGGTSRFLSLFLKGMSIEEITAAQIDRNRRTVSNEKIIGGKYDMVVTSSPYGKGEIYSYAYVTLPSFKIYQLMK